MFGHFYGLNLFFLFRFEAGNRSAQRKTNAYERRPTRLYTGRSVIYLLYRLLQAGPSKWVSVGVHCAAMVLGTHQLALTSVVKNVQTIATADHGLGRLLV